MNKKILSIFLILILSATVLVAAGSEIQVSGNIDTVIPEKDMIVGELEEPVEPGFFSRWFTFSFVETTPSESRTSGDFEVDGTYGAYGPVDKGIFTSTGNAVSAGTKCASGQYIRLFEYVKGDDGKYHYSQDLFNNIYKKTSSDDNIVFANYWIADMEGPYYYGYSCLDRISGTSVDHYEYYCRDKEIFSSDDQAANYDCEYKCAKDTYVATSKLSESKLVSEMCEEPSLTGSISAVALTTVKTGADYVVSGKVKINGECNGCVIETGMRFYSQQLTLVSGKGACGDDDTVGIKFDAEDEILEYKLADTALNTVGKRRLSVRLYDGCASEGKGKLLAEDTVDINIVSSTTTTTTGTTTTDDDDMDVDTDDSDVTTSTDTGQDNFCQNNPQDKSCLVDACDENPDDPICVSDVDCDTNPDLDVCQTSFDLSEVDYEEIYNDYGVIIAISIVVLMLSIVGVIMWRNRK